MFEIKDRLFKKRIIDTNGCWLFIGADNKQYGKVRFGGRLYNVHVLSYILFKDDYNPELFVLHKCDVSNCFNPDHLYQGTQQNNMHDRLIRNRGTRKPRTHCPHGHEYTIENTHLYRKNGKNIRVCIKCARAHTKHTNSLR